jgi:hypothetical protein
MFFCVERFAGILPGLAIFESGEKLGKTGE